MTIVKVKNMRGVEGVVTVENWADPRIWMMDFQVANDGFDKYGDKVVAGDTMPLERENLEFVKVEE